MASKSKSVDELNRQNDSLKEANSTLSDQVKELGKKLSASEDKFEQSEALRNKFQEENSRLENRVTELTTKCKEMEQSTSKSEPSDVRILIIKINFY